MKATSGHARYMVAFHVVRQDIVSPWDVIGVYASGSHFTSARYAYEYLYIRDAYLREVERCGRIVIASSREFLESWRADHREIDSVITPIINVRSLEQKGGIFLRQMYINYVGTSSITTFARLAMILKSRDDYVAGSHNSKYYNKSYENIHGRRTA